MVYEKARKCIVILLSVCTEEELAVMLEESCWSPGTKAMIRERLEFLQGKAGVPA